MPISQPGSVRSRRTSIHSSRRNRRRHTCFSLRSTPCTCKTFFAKSIPTRISFMATLPPYRLVDDASSLAIRCRLGEEGSIPLLWVESGHYKCRGPGGGDGKTSHPRPAQGRRVPARQTSVKSSSIGFIPPHCHCSPVA